MWVFVVEVGFDFLVDFGDGLWRWVLGWTCWPILGVSGDRVQGSGGSGFTVQGIRYRVQGTGITVYVGGDFGGGLWWWRLGSVLLWTLVMDFGGGVWVGLVGRL